MTKKTLLLVFIHGFKGSDDTFERFPDHLRILLAEVLPKINVLSIVYPQFETRGDLTSCVIGFKEWLQNKVIDLEVASHTPSPTIDPSVHVVLVGHSMGGIVAAETLLSVGRDQVVPPTTSTTPPPGVGNNNTTSAKSTTSAKRSGANLSAPTQTTRSSSAPPPGAKATPTKSRTANSETDTSTKDESSTLLFPRIQGILAFDTPYLGIHPGVVAHGAEAHYNTASAAFNAYSSASKMFGFGSKTPSAAQIDTSRALPAARNASGPGWGKYAMYAGGVAALAAAGGAAWVGREQLTGGWSWATSHLEFVGCLARGAELVQRVDAVVQLSERCHVGFADFYTRLEDQGEKTAYAKQLLGEERTFCVVPKDAKGKTETDGDGGESPRKKRKTDPGRKIVGIKGTWVECVNKNVEDEIAAHRAMFTPKMHSGYYGMCDRAKNMVAAWVDRAWYEESAEEDDIREGKEDEAGEEDADAGASP